MEVYIFGMQVLCQVMHRYLLFLYMKLLRCVNYQYCLPSDVTVRSLLKAGWYQLCFYCYHKSHIGNNFVLVDTE